MYDKFVQISFLYDYYGKTLTDKQREIIDLYYFKDLSLGEIGENLNISRQAVHDNLKRGERQLKEMEKKLGLVDRFLKGKDKCREVVEKTDGIIERLRREKDVSREIICDLEDLKELIGEILGG